MDTMNFIPFSKPEVGPEELANVTEVLKSGWLTTGPYAKQFEDDFVNFMGGDVEAIAVSSATSGLHLALEAMGVCPGDEVITTTHTFTATAEVIRYLGANPVFVDIDRETFCIDPTEIEKAITPATKVIIPVHYAGRAADMMEILRIAQKYDVKVLEDAAHALPTRENGRLVGTLESDATVFSFYANKTMTTGEGGMVVTRDQEIAKRCRVMRLHGIDRDAFGRFTSEKPSWWYEVVAPGFKYNMPDIAAAIGVEQLKKVNGFQKRREELAKFYNKALADLPIICPQDVPESDLHAWHLYVIQLKPECGIGRDEFIEKMYAEKVGCSVHYIPLHLQPYWRDKYQLKPEMFPVSQNFFEHCVSLPLYSGLSLDSAALVVSAIKRILS